MLSFTSPTIIVSVLVPVFDGDPVEGEREREMRELRKRWVGNNLLVSEIWKGERCIK